jgi:hypothetical protein
MTDNYKKAALTERLAKCYSGAVYDALRERGIDNTVLPKDIRPIDDTQVIAGPIFTVSGTPKPGISADDALLAWTGFLIHNATRYKTADQNRLWLLPTGQDQLNQRF